MCLPASSSALLDCPENSTVSSGGPTRSNPWQCGWYDRFNICSAADHLLTAWHALVYIQIWVYVCWKVPGLWVALSPLVALIAYMLGNFVVRVGLSSAPKDFQRVNSMPRKVGLVYCNGEISLCCGCAAMRSCLVASLKPQHVLSLASGG